MNEIKWYNDVPAQSGIVEILVVLIPLIESEGGPFFRAEYQGMTATDETPWYAIRELMNQIINKQEKTNET